MKLCGVSMGSFGFISLFVLQLVTCIETGQVEGQGLIFICPVSIQVTSKGILSFLSYVRGTHFVVVIFRCLFTILLSLIVESYTVLPA